MFKQSSSNDPPKVSHPYTPVYISPNRPKSSLTFGSWVLNTWVIVKGTALLPIARGMPFVFDGKENHVEAQS
nr:MAG TPA: hypothetical protein [Caudoviricetes sp.]